MECYSWLELEVKFDFVPDIGDQPEYTLTAWRVQPSSGGMFQLPGLMTKLTMAK